MSLLIPLCDTALVIDPHERILHPASLSWFVDSNIDMHVCLLGLLLQSSDKLAVLY